MISLARIPRDVSRNPGRVLTKADFNAASELGLSHREPAQAIGDSEATVSRLKGGAYELRSKLFELATCLVRVFQSLDAIAGGDPDTTKAWMRAINTDLHDLPAHMLAQTTGLVAVMNYLNADRAH